MLRKRKEKKGGPKRFAFRCLNLLLNEEMGLYTESFMEKEYTGPKADNHRFLVIRDSTARIQILKKLLRDERNNIRKCAADSQRSHKAVQTAL